jgi:DNA-binding protein HU-beta
MAKTAAKPMTKAQIMTTLAEKTDLPKKKVVEVMDALRDLAYKEAKKGFTIPGIGKLVVVKRKARTGRNPQTGESIKIPAKTTLKFRVAKAAKDAITPPKK